MFRQPLHDRGRHELDRQVAYDEPGHADAGGGSSDTTANPARASRSASPGLGWPERTTTGRCPAALVTSTATGDPAAPVRRNDRFAGVARALAVAEHGGVGDHCARK